MAVQKDKKNIAKEKSGTSEDPKTSAEKVKTLVVDDEEIVRSFLIDVLTDEGYQVTAVSSGDEAVKLLTTNDYDLIITDIKMPGTDGMEVLRVAKARDPNQNVISGKIGFFSTSLNSFKTDQRRCRALPRYSDGKAGSWQAPMNWAKVV